MRSPRQKINRSRIVKKNNQQNLESEGLEKTRRRILVLVNCPSRDGKNDMILRNGFAL